MLRNLVTLNGLSDDQKFFAKSYIIPTLIESTELSGKTFTDGEIAELYEINLTTARKWRKYIRNEWQPNTNLCCSYSLPKIWKINDNKTWERTGYNPNKNSPTYVIKWTGLIINENIIQTRFIVKKS